MHTESLSIYVLILVPSLLDNFMKCEEKAQATNAHRRYVSNAESLDCDWLAFVAWLRLTNKCADLINSNIM